MTKIELPASVLEEHLNVTSSLYQPKNVDDIPTKSSEISSHLERIKKKLARVEELERKRNETHMRRQWEQYEMKRTTSLAEYKRPLTTVFLIASGVYISLHAVWWFLEREKRVDELTREQRRLVGELDTKLQIQNKVVINETKKSWLRWWWW